MFLPYPRIKCLTNIKIAELLKTLKVKVLRIQIHFYEKKHIQKSQHLSNIEQWLHSAMSTGEGNGTAGRELVSKSHQIIFKGRTIKGRYLTMGSHKNTFFVFNFVLKMFISTIMEKKVLTEKNMEKKHRTEKNHLKSYYPSLFY